MNVNVFQFDVEWLNPQKNISTIQAHIESLEGKLDLVVLPEMYLSGFCMNPDQAAVSEDGPEIEQLKMIAATHSIGIMGSLAIRQNDKFFNRVLLISEEGIVGRYDKQYLYSPSGENEAFDSIFDPQLISFRGWKILPQVCYDLRFPENVRQLPAPDLLVYSANWPAPRIHHWDALLKARAIENQCYTIGCNRLGVDNNEWEYPGHSAIVRPDGLLLNMEQNLSESIVALDISVVEEYRTKYRFQEDRRYKILTKW